MQCGVPGLNTLLVLKHVHSTHPVGLFRQGVANATIRRTSLEEMIAKDLHHMRPHCALQFLFAAIVSRLISSYLNFFK